MANVVVSALATWNGKALKKGKQDLNAFDKQAKALNKSLTRLFATGALVAFSKKAINAFANDEKAAKSLAVQLENTGNAFRVSEVENYIASLQSLYGILDDQLRPAFQTLLNATGSITLSQKALETALNVSAGTGKDLASVVAAIAKGATGTTTALSRLGTGLDKATIASGDMNKIMAALDKKFAGQAAARLDTYAGKMDLLKVASANATEIIGKGLIDALTALSKDNSIDQAANSMNNFANAIANTTKGMGELIGQVKQIIDSDVGKFLLGLTALLTLGKKQLIGATVGLIAYDIGKTPKSTSNFSYGQGNPRADLILARNLTKARKDEYAIITASNKAKTEIDKLSEKFDTERIALMKALGEATDAETKLRLQSKLAILDNNEALAKKYNAELNAAKGATDLASAFNGAILSLSSSKTDIMKYLNDLAALQTKQLAAGTPLTAPNLADTAIVQRSIEQTLESVSNKLPGLLEKARTTVKSGYDIPSPEEFYGKLPSSEIVDRARSMAAAAPIINVNVEGSLTSLQEFETTIQDLLLKIYKQNGDLAPAGFIQ